MKIEGVPFTVTLWDTVEPVEHPGTTGSAVWRLFEHGNVRVRMVEYSPGFLQDHWCPRGHVMLVLQGEVGVELSDGARVTLRPGQSFQVADDASSHRLLSDSGARVFVVD